MRSRKSCGGDRRAGRFWRWTLAAVCGQAIGLAAAADAQVQWKNGTDVAQQKMSRADLRDALVGLAARPGQKHVVVQFDRAITSADRERLKASGVELLSPLGGNAFFAALDPAGLDAGAAAALSSFSNAQPIKRNWKMHTFLAAAQVPEWAVVDPGVAPEGEADPEEAAKPDAVIGAYVMFHRDVPLADEARNAVTAVGGVVRDSLESVNSLVIELPMSRIDALVQDDRVQWIEPALPKFKELNDSNRALTGADIVQAPPYGLDGSGVTVLVYDGGTGRSTHQDFGGRHTNGDTDALSSHSTHVAGTIGGSGAASGGLRRGMAPGVLLLGYGFEYDGTGTFLYNNPGDLESDYTNAINVRGADISNNSIGTNTAANGFPCSLEGDYGVTDALIDAIVTGSLGAPFRIVWANGNERTGGGGRCGTTYSTTPPPSVAKNSISVGALNSNDDSVTAFTSWGPTDDGRMKPDVSAPGCQVGSDGGVTSCSSTSDTSYSSSCGTSMASPTVCGLGALLLEDYRALHPGAPDFRNSTLKVLLAHTAQDITNPGPDYQTGYGSVRIQPAVDFLRTGNILENQVSQGGSYQALVLVSPGDPVLKITMAWDDPTATPNVIPNLINDLDLVVTDPLGARRYPWTLNPASPASLAVQTQENHRDISEQVFVASPMAGVWRVEVRGTTVPQGPQTFSLGASPLLIQCSPQGVLSMDSQFYRCSDTAVVRVVDCDLNIDDEAIETVTVFVSSTSDTGGEMLTLTETAAPSAAFEGSVALNQVGGPGALVVAHGDTITASYIDADDGAGGMNVVVEDMSTVDCVAPVVSNVVVSNLQARSATISFMTDEPALSTVGYATSCAGPFQNVSPSGFNTSHTVNLQNLTDDTTYFFRSVVEDGAVNVATYDNGGTCFTFTTPDIPDFYTELYSAGTNDVDNRSVLFTPDGSISFYSACSDAISVLPTDPAGGTPIALLDNASVNVPLSGGAQVRLYGTAYSSFFVGSNGYITFTASDIDSSESLTDHFDTPRISALFDDLDPAQAGQVSWKQLPDRAVVTYLNVTENIAASNSNTFQIEMFFDGRIRISWLAIAITDGLAGIGQGTGQNPLFSESDLTAYSSCGPMPPGAQSAQVETPANTPLPITLLAADDGQPIPPSLTYTVLTLPSHGALSAAGVGLITTAPTSLPPDLNQVTYTPAVNYQGPDSFMFNANDGGSPPDGGDSNTATISITVGVPALIYEFNLTTDPGWTVENQWAFGVPTGGGTAGRLDPVSGFTGPNVYGFNLNGHYPNSMPQTYYLTTGAIDCSMLDQTTLKFRRWLGIESSTFDHASIQVSTDGAAWTTVWNHNTAAINESTWSLQSYDISAIADDQATVFIRWGMGTTDGSVTYHGWNIDDVQIFGVLPLSGAGADINGDGDVNAIDLALLLGSWGACPAPCPADLDGDGAVGAPDLALLLGSWDPGA